MTDTTPKPSMSSHNSTLDLVLTFVVDQEPGGEPAHAGQVEGLDADRAQEIVLAIDNPTLRAELGPPWRQDQFLRLLRLIEPKLTNQAAKDLVELLVGYPGELYDAVDDPRVRQLIDRLSA